MRKVTFAAGVESSVLGFGCAPILGAVGTKEARNAIACALDLGINHFDVARCYGYGDAEKFVGRELKALRDNVVIVSKFGLAATGLARILRPTKPIVRYLRGRHVARPAAAPADNNNSMGPLLRRLPVTADDLQRGLEQSLKALGTDYLDILMLHEPTWSALPVDEIACVADALKSQGKIRAFGAAFYRSKGALPEAASGIFDVLQFDCPVAGADYDSLKETRASSANVLFSPSRAGAPGSSLPETLASLWKDFPRSVVLSSMFNPDHIRANAAAAV